MSKLPHPPRVTLSQLHTLPGPVSLSGRHLLSPVAVLLAWLHGRFSTQSAAILPKNAGYLKRDESFTYESWTVEEQRGERGQERVTEKQRERERKGPRERGRERQNIHPE